MNKRVLESLIKAGAMDSLGARRAQLMAALDRALEAGARVQRDREMGQRGLFGMPLESAATADQERLPDVPEWDERQLLTFEKEVLGFYVSGHPLATYLEKLREVCTADTSTLEGRAAGEEVTIGGLIAGLRSMRTKRGDPWAIAQLEDLNGFVDLLVFPEAYKRLSDRLAVDTAVFVRGRVNPEENAPPKIAVSDLVPLETVEVRLPENLLIRIRLRGNGAGAGPAPDSLARELAELFQRKQGQATVRLEVIREGDFAVTLEPTIRVRPDKEFLAAVESICGKGSVIVI
jgi:DNA polymerase-3 subunit alpha